MENCAGSGRNRGPRTKARRAEQREQYHPYQQQNEQYSYQPAVHVPSRQGSLRGTAGHKGGIEKLAEYRNVSNGQVEVRRITSSLDGPVEHIQVINPETATLPMPWLEYDGGHPSLAVTSWSQGMAPIMKQEKSHHPKEPQQSQKPKYRRLAMNGSQPCLMTLDRPTSNSSKRGSGGASGGGGLLYSTGNGGGGAVSGEAMTAERVPSTDKQSRRRRTLVPLNSNYPGEEHWQDRPIPQSQHCVTIHQGSEMPLAMSRRITGSQPCLLTSVNTHIPNTIGPLSSGRTSHQEHHHHHHHLINESGLKDTSQRSNNTLVQRSESFSHERAQSPLSAVRAKRATQAKWERNQQRKQPPPIDMPETHASLQGPVLFHPHTHLPAQDYKSHHLRHQLQTNLYGGGTTTDSTDGDMLDDEDEDDEDDVPPPPSPPCTCGKVLEFPPTPPLENGIHHTRKSPRTGSLRHSQPVMPLEESGAWDSQSLDGRLPMMNGMSLPRQGTKDMMQPLLAPSGQRSKSASSQALPQTGPMFPNQQFSSEFAHWATVKSPRMIEDDEVSQCIKQKRGAFAGKGDMFTASAAEFNPDLIVRHPRTASFGYHDQQVPQQNGHHVSNGHAAATPCRVPSPPSFPSGKPPHKRPFKARLLQGERGVSLEFGKFVALISISGVRFQRQHWCFLSIVILILVLCIALGLPLSGDEIQIPATEEARMEMVQHLLTEVPLVDGHNDLPWNIRKFIHNKIHTVNFTYDLRNISPWSRSAWSHTDLNRLKQGRVGAQLWVAYAPCGSQHRDAVQVTLEQIDLIKRMINQYPNHLAFVNDSTSLMEAHAGGKIASLISVESGHSIGTSLAVLRMFHRLGAVSLTLTHNCNTPWADCSDADKPDVEPTHNGLSTFGKTVIKEMNRLGMIIDLSHSSRQTSMDAIETSEAPVIFSHSSAFALCNSTRNVQDDLLKLLAKKKGMVMVNFFSYYLTCSNKSTIHDVVGHLTHIKEVAGPDSVGIGASYDGINSLPEGLEDVSKYPELFSMLLASGMWTLEELKKLAGLNFIRVFQEVEKVSLSMFPGINETSV